MSAVRAFDKGKTGVEQAYDVETIMSQTAHVKGVLTSPYMERHADKQPYTEFPKGLKVVFYSDSLTITSVLTARYGKYMDGQNDIFLRDSVVFLNLKEMKRLDCKELRYDAKRRMFISNSFVRLSTPLDTLYGQGLESNEDFTDSRILKAYGNFAQRDSMFSAE